MTFQFYSFKLLRKKASSWIYFSFRSKNGEKTFDATENLTSQSWSRVFWQKRPKLVSMRRECKSFLSIKTTSHRLCSIFDVCKNLRSIWVKETARWKLSILERETLTKKKAFKGRKRHFQFIYLSHSLQSRSTVKTNSKVIHPIRAFLFS